MKPRGATELQHEMLEKHVSKELLDQVQICTSIPGKVPIDPNKLNILWQKNSWDQPNLQEFFTNKERHKEHFVSVCRTWRFPLQAVRPICKLRLCRLLRKYLGDLLTGLLVR